MTNEMKQAMPWWQNAKVITLLGSIIAAAIPLTTYVAGYMQKKTELELNAQKQNHQIRMDYINRALTPNLTEAEQELIFELFAEMEDQPALKKWAEKKRSSLRNRIKELEDGLIAKEKEKEELKKVISESAKTIANLESSILKQKANSSGTDDTSQLNQQLQAELDNSDAEIAKLSALQEETESLRERVGKPIQTKTNVKSIPVSQKRYFVIAMTSGSRKEIEREIEKVKDNFGRENFEQKFPDVEIYEGGYPYTLLINGDSLPYKQASALKDEAIAAGFGKDTWLWSSKVPYFSSKKQ